MGAQMTFNPSSALSALEAVHLAYDRPTLWGGNGQAYVTPGAPTGNVAAIAGTNAPRDAYQDAQFWKKEIGQGREVHGGFWHHFKGLEMPLTEKVFLPAILTGHSLGAAVAVLAVAMYPMRFAGCAVYLFGCPLVGNSNFATIFNAECKRLGITVWRIVNRGDPVAGLKIPGDWAHVGKLIEIGKAGDAAPDHTLSAYRAELESMR